MKWINMNESIVEKQRKGNTQREKKLLSKSHSLLLLLALPERRQKPTFPHGRKRGTEQGTEKVGKVIDSTNPSNLSVAANSIIRTRLMQITTVYHCLLTGAYKSESHQM